MFGMSPVQPRQLETIGFGGDGDEVGAIEAVERHFGVALDPSDAHSWRTAGDVFGALVEALPAGAQHRDDLWPVFTVILCKETGADHLRVGPNTLLLALPLRVVIGRWLGRVFRPPA